MSSIGKTTTEGQFSSNLPTADDILKRLGVGGWEGLLSGKPTEHLKAGLEASGAQELLRAYAMVYALPAGRMVIEDLMDQSIRRSPFLNGAATLEQQTAYGLERKGMAAFMTYILSMVHRGQKLPDPAAPKKKAKRK